MVMVKGMLNIYVSHYPTFGLIYIFTLELESFPQSLFSLKNSNKIVIKLEQAVSKATWL